MKTTLKPSLVSLHRATHMLPAALVVLGLTGAGLRGFAQVDNFNDGNDTGWVRVDPIDQAAVAYGYPPFGLASWTFPSGGYQIACATPPVPDFGPARAGSMWTNAAFTYTNFYVAVDVRPWGQATNQAIGLMGRVQAYSGSGATYAYTLTYEPNVRDLQITRFDGGTYTALGAKKVSLSPTNTHRFVFIGKGDTFEARAYLASDPTTPLETVTGSDPLSAYTEGWCGLLVFDSANPPINSLVATFDNYVALPEEPPALSIVLSNQLAVVSWPVSVGGYSLQATPTLAPANWTTITSGITQADGRFSYSTPPVDKWFYRLLPK